MKLSDLKQYEKLKNEITELKEQIRKDESREDVIVADTVKDYRDGERVIIIRGYDERLGNKIGKARMGLIERRIKAENKRLEIETFIDEVEDSEIRQIIQYKYIDGMAWKVIARKIYGSPCEDRPRKKIIRFFEKK